jgi:hypothetical protein
MVAALDGVPPKPFVQPQGVVLAEVCTLSGLLPTPECRENGLPVHGLTKDLFVQGVNLPTKADDWHQRVEVCKVNGKRATPLVPDNARDIAVFATLPEPYRAWAAGHGFAAPPTEDCSDIYQGERVASILGPGPSDRLIVGQTLQVVGSAYIDDFANYTLDFGPGDNPSVWTPITNERKQAVDKALLGVWETAGLAPGRYRLRLRAVDSFANTQESAPLIVTLTPPATPTPLPTPTAVRPPPTPTRGPTLPATPQPTRAPTPRPTPRP